MALSEEEILREADRIRAARGLGATKRCARCGESFVGIAQAKYCSDACRMAAARGQHGTKASYVKREVRIEPELPGESYRDYFVRIGGALTPENEEFLAALERVRARAMPFRNENGEIENSTEFIQRDREERARRLAGL